MATALSFLLGFYLLSLANNFGAIFHRDTLPTLVCAAFMCSRCGDAWSVDVWLRRRRPRAGTVVPSGEYTWPVRLVWVMFAVVFFSAGFAKLRNSGLTWVFSDNLARRLVLGACIFPGSPVRPDWSLELAMRGRLCQLFAGLTVLLEVGFPLCLIWWRLRWLFIPGSLVMQIAIIYLMGPNFMPFMLCNLFWVPWDRVLPKAVAAARRLGTLPGWRARIRRLSRTA